MSFGSGPQAVHRPGEVDYFTPVARPTVGLGEMDDTVYNPQQLQQQSQQHVWDFTNANPNYVDQASYDHANNGWFWNTFMDKVLPVVVIAANVVGAGVALGAAAGVGSAAGGLGGEAAAAGAAGAAEVGGAGALGTAGAAGAGAVGAGGLGAGAAAGTTLGTTLGAAGIPQVVISGAAGAGAASSGLGGLAALGAAGAGTAGLAGMASGGSTGQTMPDGSSGQPVQNSPSTNPSLENILGNNPTQPINSGALQNLPAVNGAAGSSALSSLGGYAKDLSNIWSSVSPYIAGNVDRIKANQSADWWKSQLDTLQGMYAPGTPEATLMQQQMEAKDAASGRRSQYGVRAVNLASALAEKRANIMTSAGYQNMANAYQNRSSSDLNGLFAAAGNSNTSNTSGLFSSIGNIANGIGSLFGK